MEKKKHNKRATFPLFDDGDVLIVLSGNVHCRLHSQVLANNSEVFRVMLSQASAAKITKSSHVESVTIRWRFHLDMTDPDDEDISLTPIPLGGDGTPFPFKGISQTPVGIGMPDPISEVRRTHV